MPNHCANKLAVRQCARILRSKVSRPFNITHALNALMVGPPERLKATTGSISSARPTSAPPKTRPWPSRYLVAEWVTISAPRARGCCKTGVQKQLSTARIAPNSRLTTANPARSAIALSGFDGVSKNNKRVFDVAAPRQASRSVSGTKLISTPNFRSVLSNSPTVAPKTSCEHNT